MADLWVDWPVHDAALDLVISIFAPKNFAETARVLRPGGWLAVVYPGPDHLVELSHPFALMRQHEGKGRRYIDAAQRHIGPPAVSRLTRPTVIEGEAISNALLMGPNARRINRSTLDSATDSLSITFDVFVLMARKPGSNAD
jgi:23S rRNA (guanine745-N1)-methyltransferase